MSNLDSSVELHNAILKGDCQAVCSLIQRGCNPDAVLKKSTRLTSIIFAIVNGNANMVKTLIRCGASLDLQDHRGMTAVMVASFYNRREILLLLQCAQADFTLSDNDGRTALHHAAQAGSLECLDVLLDCRKLDINQVDLQEKSVVMYAACGENIVCLKRLVHQIGIDVDLPDTDGNTPLIMTVHLRKKDHANILIRKGANLNVRNKKRKTALSKAFEQTKNAEMLELVEILLMNGAKPSFNPTDELYLHEMIARGKKKIVQFMLVNGCSPRMRICKENTFRFDFPQKISPLGVALLSNEHSIARYLIANMFLTSYDITCLPHSQDIRIHLLKEGFSHCGTLQRALSLNPLPLFVLCIRAGLDLMYDKVYKYKDHSQQAILSELPRSLQHKIQFRSNLAFLCIKDWETMPLMFEAGQDVPIPRPLASVWPIGHRLVECQFECCAGSNLHGYRIVKKEPLDDSLFPDDP